jgi:hypothetical protein
MSPLGLAIPPRCLADMGQSRPNWAVGTMSGLPLTATELRTSWEVRFVQWRRFNSVRFCSSTRNHN